MTSREKKLLGLAAIAAVLIATLFAHDFYKKKKIQLLSKEKRAQALLTKANMYQKQSQDVNEEIEWLKKHEPKAISPQAADSQLQKLVESSVTATGLTLKTQKPLASDQEPGRFYQRAKIEISLSGSEPSLYRSLDQLNNPTKLIAVTHLRLTPNKQDDKLIDCTATIEQWFTPDTSKP